jgi:hypothetical protein
LHQAQIEPHLDFVAAVIAGDAADILRHSDPFGNNKLRRSELTQRKVSVRLLTVYAPP